MDDQEPKSGKVMHYQIGMMSQRVIMMLLQNTQTKSLPKVTDQATSNKAILEGFGDHQWKENSKSNLMIPSQTQG